MFEIGGADVVSYGELMREYARQRGLRRLHHPGAGADAAPLEPLARAGDAALRARRPQADREHARTRRSCTTTRRARTLPVRPDGIPGGDRAGARQRGSRVRRDALVGRPVVRRARRGAGAACRFGSPARGLARGPRRRAAGGGVRADRAARRRDGLVLRRLALAPARLPRPAGRRRRHPPRPARSRQPARRRRGRLLARRGDRARAGCSASPPRCGSRAGRGSSSRSSRDGPASVIRQTAIFDPVGLPGSPTGTRSTRSTGSSSAACCAASPAPPSRPRRKRSSAPQGGRSTPDARRHDVSSKRHGSRRVRSIPLEDRAGHADGAQTASGTRRGNVQLTCGADERPGRRVGPPRSRRARSAATTWRLGAGRAPARPAGRRRTGT